MSKAQTLPSEVHRGGEMGTQVSALTFEKTLLKCLTPDGKNSGSKIKSTPGGVQGVR